METKTDISPAYTFFTVDMLLHSTSSWLTGKRENALTGDEVIEKGYWDYWNVHKDTDGRKYSAAALVSAAKVGNTKAIEWLRNKLGNIPISQDVLQAAATGGHLDTTVYCIHNGCKVTDACVEAAAENGNLQLMEEYISKGANLTTRALGLAACKNQQGIVKAILNGRVRGAVKPTIGPNESILQWPASTGANECLTLLLQDGIQVTAADIKAAMTNGDAEVVKMLTYKFIEAGNKLDIDLLTWAATLENDGMVDLLMELGAPVSTECLFVAAAHGHVYQFRLFLSQPHIKVTDPVMIITARNGWVGELEILHNAGCSFPYKCWESVARYGKGWASLVWARHVLKIQYQPSLLKEAIEGKQVAYAKRLVYECGIPVSEDLLKQATDSPEMADFVTFLNAERDVPM